MEDVLFLQDGNRRAIFDNPFIKRTFSPAMLAPPLLPSDKTVTPSTTAPCLFALGIVLIELYYGKPLKELRTEKDMICADDVHFFCMLRAYNHCACFRISHRIQCYSDSTITIQSYCFNSLLLFIVEIQPL